MIFTSLALSDSSGGCAVGGFGCGRSLRGGGVISFGSGSVRLSSINRVFRREILTFIEVVVVVVVVVIIVIRVVVVVIIVVRVVVVVIVFVRVVTIGPPVDRVTEGQLHPHSYPCEHQDDAEHDPEHNVFPVRAHHHVEEADPLHEERAQRRKVESFQNKLSDGLRVCNQVNNPCDEDGPPRTRDN